MDKNAEKDKKMRKEDIKEVFTRVLKRLIAFLLSDKSIAFNASI